MKRVHTEKALKKHLEIVKNILGYRREEEEEEEEQAKVKKNKDMTKAEIAEVRDFFYVLVINDEN